ncbi:MAG: hypothetical protein AB1815_01195 [Bacillota bacterium]
MGNRVKAAGFLKTLLLRRVGSTIYAGRLTAEKMLRDWQCVVVEDDEEDDAPISPEMKSLTPEEQLVLQRFVASLKVNERDPKYDVVMDCLLNRGWLEMGCIVFSQYYDSVFWLAENISQELPEEKIAIYAGSQCSGIMHDNVFTSASRDDLKKMVARGEIRLLLGTDAGSICH